MTLPAKPATPIDDFSAGERVAAAPHAEQLALQVSLSQVLAAMSRALDLTEGQKVGHTVRTCVIGMRLAEETGLSTFDCVALYGALLLKDAGRSSNQLGSFAPRGGDRSRESAVRRTGRTDSTTGIRARIGALLGMARAKGESAGDDNSAGRGESIALRLGFSRATADAIRSIDEHWDGTGSPDRLVGHEIPLLSRIILLAQSLDSLHIEGGVHTALRVARERAGFSFDPGLVRVARSWREDTGWWESLCGQGVTARAVSLEPAQHTRYVDGKGLDEVAKAFAEIIDSRSRFTFQHSTNVAKYARATAFELNFTREERATINRAALLHDVGKLGVSSRILEKAGPLTSDERAEMQRHPIYTWEILQRVNAFSDFARTAALHHEKLDGTGYPWGVTGDELDMPARILCVSDMYEALTANRPYRAGLSRDTALKIIEGGSGRHACPDATAALAEATRNLRVSHSS